jgi:hypothetical protein
MFNVDEGKEQRIGHVVREGGKGEMRSQDRERCFEGKAVLSEHDKRRVPCCGAGC